jgi:hypothetical protein
MFRTRTITPVAVVALALAAPGADARPDLRSPDAIDRAAAPAKVDLVSPDARYGVPQRDSRAPSVVTIRNTRVVEVPQGGFEWGDAAIGGGATVALLLTATGIALTVRPRRSSASIS